MPTNSPHQPDMSADLKPDTERLSAEAAIALIQRHQKLKPHEDWRLTVAICNPGGLTAHQTVEVVGIQGGFDWTARQLIVQPIVPLSTLSPEQVADITKSVRAGGSWHAYEREKKSRAELTAAQAQIAALQAECDELKAFFDARDRDVVALNAIANELRVLVVKRREESDALQAKVQELTLQALSDNGQAIEREAELVAERDAAFAMSRCECSGDEACANLAKMRAERDAALARLTQAVELLKKTPKVCNDIYVPNGAAVSFGHQAKALVAALGSASGAAGEAT